MDGVEDELVALFLQSSKIVRNTTDDQTMDCQGGFGDWRYEPDYRGLMTYQRFRLSLTSTSAVFIQPRLTGASPPSTACN